ncbi:hypothetical protein NL676_013664 [Syzygium grande]|nr:hypothetical protein NL676_013664 [Syzygium grande]
MTNQHRDRRRGRNVKIESDDGVAGLGLLPGDTRSKVAQGLPRLQIAGEAALIRHPDPKFNYPPTNRG